IRFQIRYKFPPRSVSKSAIVTLSTPGAPLLAFTCRYASQTSHLEISNDFPADFSSSMHLLPDSPRLTHEQRHRCPGPFAPPPPRPAGTSALLRAGPPAHPRSVLNPLRVHPRLGHSLLPSPTIRDASTRACLPTFPARAADQTHDAYMPDGRVAGGNLTLRLPRNRA